MSKKEYTCIVCPRGCRLKVYKEHNEIIVEGNTCKRGLDYGKKEFINPVRTLTTTVKIRGARFNRLPVMTDQEIPKDMIFDVMKEINKIELQAPIEYQQIIIKNIKGTGCNLIASRSMNKI